MIIASKSETKTTDSVFLTKDTIAKLQSTIEFTKLIMATFFAPESRIPFFISRKLLLPNTIVAMLNANATIINKIIKIPITSMDLTFTFKSPINSSIRMTEVEIVVTTAEIISITSAIFFVPSFTFPSKCCHKKAKI